MTTFLFNEGTLKTSPIYYFVTFGMVIEEVCTILHV